MLVRYSGDPGPRRAAGGRDSAGDETLSEAFWAVARQLRETSQESLAPWDITPSQLRALRVLRAPRGRCACRSCRTTCTSRRARPPRWSTPWRPAAWSERRPDPGDRRATLVELTEHGGGVLDAIRGTEAERVFGRLSQADRAHLARILRKLRD